MPNQSSTTGPGGGPDSARSTENSSGTPCCVSAEQRSGVIATVRRRIDENVNDLPVIDWGRCIVAAHFTCEELLERGCKAVLQAGSMQWPRIRPEQDDGKCATHFAYMWTPTSPISQRQLRRGATPELHAWVGILDTQEIVDVQTRYFPQACQLLIGQDWPGDPPPDYLWASEAPHGVVYDLDGHATMYVAARILKLFNPWYLQPVRESLERVQQSLGF